VLEWLGFSQPVTLHSSLVRQARIMIIFYWMTFSVLKASKPRFQQVKPNNNKGSLSGAPSGVAGVLSSAGSTHLEPTPEPIEE
jgi:hypothetical protein